MKRICLLVVAALLISAAIVVAAQADASRCAATTPTAQRAAYRADGAVRVSWHQESDATEAGVWKRDWPAPWTAVLTQTTAPGGDYAAIDLAPSGDRLYYLLEARADGTCAFGPMQARYETYLPLQAQAAQTGPYPPPLP